MTARTPRVILVEGLPGSGKTTTAEWIWQRLRARGVDVAWFREEDAEHPVIDGELRRSATEAGYADRCIERWRRYAGALGSHEGVVVLEGCWFQSTVRFMLEHEHPDGEPRRYLTAAEATLVPLQARLIYLVQRDPRAFVARTLPARKGDDVTERIAQYTQDTAWARRRGVTGIEALVDFYGAYRALCDYLVRDSRMPTLWVDTSSGDRNAHRAVMSAFLAESFAAPGEIPRP